MATEKKTLRVGTCQKQLRAAQPPGGLWEFWEKSVETGSGQRMQPSKERRLVVIPTQEVREPLEPPVMVEKPCVCADAVAPSHVRLRALEMRLVLRRNQNFSFMCYELKCTFK